MTEPLRLNLSVETTLGPTADRLSQREHISNEDGTGTMIVTKGSKLGKQLDIRMWEVIQKEITDCYEPSQLHRLHRCGNVGI